MSYVISPFGQLCLVQQPSPLCSQPPSAARITRLPPRDPRNPIWSESCCMACAKLVGSIDLFCMPCPAEGKCIRCFNLNLQCQPVRDVDAGFFPKVQQYFQFYDLQTAFEARKSWFDRMDGTVGLLNLVLFGSQLEKINHNLEQLINLQLEKKPVDASSEAEEERSQRLKIQEHRERITELESSIARNTAEYEMYTNKNLKQKISMYVEYLKLDLEKAKTSLAKLEAEKVA